MKTKIIYLLFLTLIAVACDKGQTDIENEKLSEKLAIEMQSQMTLVEQTEPLNTSLHEEFISAELLNFFASNAGLIQKIKNQAFSESDTLFTLEEIPLIRETKTRTLIYVDGRSENYFEDLTPESYNIAAQLTETPEPDSMRISMTVSKNGELLVYNKYNQLISKQSYPETDYTEFLDSITNYLELSEQAQQLSKPAKIAVFKNNLPANASLVKLSNGNYEYLMKIAADNASLSKIFESSEITSKTELDPDLNRTLSFALFQGGNLIHKKVFRYAETDQLGNFITDRQISTNPEYIESETLIIDSKGLPAIRHTKEFYKKNQTRYYLNNLQSKL